MTVKPEIVLLEPAELVHFTHEFPVGHRLSKAWRHHFLGREIKWKHIKDRTFYVFVMDNDFGVCKLTKITAAHVRRRKKGFVLSYQTDYPKTNVVIFSIPDSDTASTFDSLHATLKLQIGESMWRPKAETSAELNALCDDSFDEEGNKDGVL